MAVRAKRLSLWSVLGVRVCVHAILASHGHGTTSARWDDSDLVGSRPKFGPWSPWFWCALTRGLLATHGRDVALPCTQGTDTPGPRRGMAVR
jgi:hypothetical protein